MFLKYFFIIFLLFNSSFAYQFKIKSVSLRSLIEKEADFWYIDNLELLKNNPTETKELTAILKISIEAGSTLGWYKYVNHTYGIDEFGKSGISVKLLFLQSKCCNEFGKLGKLIKLL